MLTAFISHPDCLLHDMGAYHPECPARLRAIEDQLIASGLMDFLQHHQAPLATRDQLVRAHAEGYVDSLLSCAPKAGLVHLDPDTAMMPHTVPAALRAAGAGILAVDLLMQGKTKTAFCNVRPPGHHAEMRRAMGFCFFNNIAVAIRHALDKHDLHRVALVDFDVHHGNGSEDIFKNDQRVLMVSTFQHPFYPYSGAEGRGERMVNVPLVAGTGSEGFRNAVETHWLPALDAFKPQMIFFSAGFDAHWEDDMASLRLLEADYAWVTEKIRGIAELHAEGRMVSMLEGGYELHALGRSVYAHLKALGGL